MQTVKNTKQSKLQSESHEIQAKAKLIIDGMFSPEVDTTIVQSRVEKALSWDSEEAVKLMKEGNFDLFHHLPESMRNDVTVVMSAIKKKRSLYHTLPMHVKSNIEVKKIVLESYIESGWSLIEILRIQDSDPKTSRELKAFVFTTYKKYKDNFPDDYSKMLYNIYTTNPDIYNLIIKTTLFVSSDTWVALGSKITEHLQKHNEVLEQESPEKVQEKIMHLIQDFLWLQASQIDDATLELLVSIASTIQIVKKKEKNKKQEEDANNQGEVDDIDDVSDDVEEYSSGPYNYVPLWNSFQVSDSEWRDVKIEKKDFESMNEKSLANYMNFHLKMKQLWMSFLIDRYASKIQIATQVDFYAGEWMSEARMLLFLNKIWKVLWMPESSYEDPDGNKKVLCFQTLWAAYLGFREMKESYIWTRTAAHDSLIEKGIINQDSWEFSIITFRDASLAKT